MDTGLLLQIKFTNSRHLAASLGPGTKIKV